MGLRAGLDWCGKFRPTGFRTPDRPARRQSLYRLSYPAHILRYVMDVNSTATNKKILRNMKKRGGLESYGIKDKMTGKNILSHAIKVYRGSRGIAPLRSSTLEEGAWLTSRSGCLSLTERAPVHTEQQSAWAPQPV